MLSRISSGVASGGDRQIVSPVAGSALPGRERASRPRDIASRATLTPSPSAGALVPLSATSSMPHIRPRPRISPTTGRSPSSCLRLSSRRLPITAARSTSPSLSMISTLRRPTAQQTGWPAIGRGVHVAAVERRVQDRVVHPLRKNVAAQWQIAAGHALGERHDVGLDAPMAEREPAPGAAEAGDDLVGDQQYVVFVADLAQFREIALGRHDDAAGAHDRLTDHAGDRLRAFGEDRLLDRLGGADAAFLVALPAIGIGRRDLDKARHQRPEHLVIRGHAGRAHRRHRDAVITVHARDESWSFPAGPAPSRKSARS